MLAIQITETGGPEVMKAVTLPDPAPGPGEILVRNKAIALNFIDTYRRKGLYPIPLPSGLGDEGAGVVEAVGEGVEDFAVGDRVAYFGGGLGAFAELYCVQAARAAPLPDGVDFETAAASLLKAMTVYVLLTGTCPIKTGDTVLVHAAAGGVGVILVQWLKSLGVTVIGTVGSEAKVALARECGCDHVILYDQEDVAARVKELTGGKGVRAAYDSVGAKTFEGSLNSLAKRGWMITFGNASGPAPAIEPLRLMRGGSLVLTRPALWDFLDGRADLLAGAKAVFDRILSGELKIHIGQRFALKDAAEAHRVMESRATLGSSVLIP